MPQLSKRRRAGFEALHKLLNYAMHSYKSSNLNFKLWLRFWKTLDAYNNGKTYHEFLQTFFGPNRLQILFLIRKFYILILFYLKLRKTLCYLS